MYIFNTTYTIETSAFNDWNNYMVTEVIPRLRKLEMFNSIRIFEVAVEQQAIDGEVYSLQLATKEVQHIGLYEEQVLPKLMELMTNAFGEKVLSFNTLLKEVVLD